MDALGAGDVFEGVLAQSLVDGRDTVQAIQRGMAAAAIKVGRSGIQNGAATMEETDALVNSKAGILRPIPVQDPIRSAQPVKKIPSPDRLQAVPTR